LLGVVPLVVFGGLALPANAAVTPRFGSSTHAEAIVTLYADPTDPQWATVDSSQNVAGAIVNACDVAGNGPGCNNSDWTSEPTGWTTTVQNLNSAGISPLIYITTHNGANSISRLETEMSQAKSWWGITDPMFDEMVGDEGTANNGSGICTDGGANISCVSYYEQLYTYAVNEGAGAVMYNPGTFYGLSSSYIYGPDEILQGFEGDEATLRNNTDPAPSWASSYAKTQFSATISAGTSANLATDIQDAVTDQDAGYVYVDNEPEPPNYTTLPPFWGSEQSDLGNTSLSGSGPVLGQITASDNSAYCLDNANGSTTNGNKIQVWRCLGNYNQKWEYVPQSGGGHELVNSNGKCLDDPQDSTTNGTKVQLWICLGNPNQEWTQVASGGYTEYVNANGMCLDDTNDSKSNGIAVQVWRCLGDAAQQWDGPQG
jgi:hypothetical protein